MSTGASETNDYLIHIEDVYQRYPSRVGGGVKTVLNDIDLRVRGGDFISVVGPSGCGKSTLLRLILGSENPSSGTVLIDGRRPDGPSRDRGIVFQKYSLFPHLTVLQNVLFGLDLEEFTLLGRLVPFHGRAQRRAFRAKAMDFLEHVGLVDAAQKYPYELSGGMRQRVAIAQAAIMEPKILLMDEPFGALDDATRQGMQLFMLELWERIRMTVFFVTHDLEEALFLGTRVLVLSQYYSADDGESTEGAKIVVDREVPGGHPKPNDFRYSPEFNELLEAIRHNGLDPDVRQHIKDFDLSHRDAWRTLGGVHA